METKDIYTASGGTTGDSFEIKQVPGYVPVAVVNPDFVAPQEQDQKDSGDSTEQDGKSEKDDSSKSTTSRKSTTSAK